MAIRHTRWYFNVTKWNPSKDQWLKMTSSIDVEEFEKINRYHFKEDAKSSLVGQLLIRKFISQAINQPSNEIVLFRTNHGRPEVSQIYKNKLADCWPKLIDFNVSHSGNFCVLAGLYSFDEVSQNLSVGIDVNAIVKKKSTEELDRFLHLMSKREFLPLEWETVTRVPDDRQKCINFTRLWCLKESYIKAIGLGLTFNLRRIQFQFTEQFKYSLSLERIQNSYIRDTQVLLDTRIANNWKFLETALDNEHFVAIGYQLNGETDFSSINLDTESPIEEITVESLLSSLTPIYQSENEQNWIDFERKSSKLL